MIVSRLFFRNEDTMKTMNSQSGSQPVFRLPLACASLSLGLAMCTALAGCAIQQDATRVSSASPSASPLPVAASTASTAPAAAGPATRAMTDAASSASSISPAPTRSAAAAPPARARTATPVATQHAVYTPVGFAELPGWSSDRLDQSWQAFLRSCHVLGSRPAWASTCADAANVDAADDAAIRAFYERHFVVYRVESTRGEQGGLLTGYFEPVVHGSRSYGGRFVYPVYGVPRDMLYLDAHRVPPNALGTLTVARIVGRQVVPLAQVSTGSMSGVFALDLTGAVPDLRDKKIRMRLSGRRIVPYYTRAEIEQRGLQADVIAYVENPAQLYTIQMQGSGKIVLQDESVVRVAYADQNGHPFSPSVVAAGARSVQHLVLRGMEVDVAEDDADASATAPTAGVGTPANMPANMQASAPSMATREPLASSMADARDAAAPGSAPVLLAGAVEEDQRSGAGVPAASARTGGQSRSVYLLADLQPAGGAGSTRARQPASGGRTNLGAVALPGAADSDGDGGVVKAHRVSVHRPASGASAAAELSPAAPFAAPARLFATSDPSYVFFKPIRDNTDGPLGALGVPLSAGRSIAVDPRTTPLGAPVYLSARTGATGGLKGLFIAQDTGGAISGAQRADLYSGSGMDAERAASTLKAPARLWVLLPAGLNLASHGSGLRTTRGGESGGNSGGNSDCLVDDGFCVDYDSTP